MVQQDCCLVPQGRFFIGEYGGVLQKALPTGGVITPQLSLIQNSYLGASEDASINNELENPESANMETRGGGLTCSTFWVRKSTLDISVVCGRAEVQAMAHLGFLREYAGGAVTAEMHAVIKNAASTVSANPKSTFVPFNRIPDWSQAYSIKNVAGDTTYTLGTDYLLGEGGIEVIHGGTIASATGPTYGATFQANYVAKDTQRVDGLVVLPQPVSIYIDGFDRVSGASRVGWIYNARGTAKKVPIKGKDIVKFDFSFVLLPDPRIPYTTANPTSQYYHFLNS